MKLKIVMVLSLMLLIPVTMCYAWDYSYDKDSPLGSDNANTLDTAIQEHKKANVERLNVDHFFGDTNNDINALTCGNHRQVTLYELSSAATVSGFSVVYNSTTSNLHFLSDDWGDVQITDEDALAVTGDISISNLTISDSLSVGNDIIVNDDLSCDGDVTVGGEVWSERNKLVSGFSGYISRDATTVYQATQSGFLVANRGGTSGSVTIEVDSSNPPTTLRTYDESDGNFGAGCSAIVQEDEYYQITCTGLDSAYYAYLD